MGKIVEIKELKENKHFCSACNVENAKYNFMINLGTMRHCFEICEDCLKQIKEDINGKK